jgi:hypothetical protein
MRGSWAMSAADFGPWTVALVALVALVGALLIHNFSRRPKRLPPTAAGGHADLPELRAAMRAAASRMDLPERLLPAIARPTGADGDFIYRDGSGYVYCSIERGTPLFEHRSADPEDLLYRVFRDRAWTRTYMDLIGQDLSPQEHAARLSKGQEALLAKAQPRWAERFAEGN